MLEFNTHPGRRTLMTFRRHLLLTCVTVTAVFAAIVALSIFVPLAAELNRVGVDDEVAAGLAEHFLFLHKALWPLIFLSLVACMVSAVVLYQRMRAPLVRFVRCFEEIGRGSVPEPLVIRAGDYLTEEADALNRMIDSLATMDSERRRAAQRIEEILDEISSREFDPILLEELTAALKIGVYPNESLSQDDA